jgi:hypothetical protein
MIILIISNDIIILNINMYNDNYINLEINIVDI